MSVPSAVRAVARLYRWALHCYPAWFREEHAESMCLTFDERMRDLSRDGSPRVLRAGIDECRSLVLHGFRERLIRRPSRAAFRHPHAVRIRPTNQSMSGFSIWEKFDMHVLSNLQYAIRVLARSPGYAAAFVLTLGLGIGANTAIFSVINGVLLQPLPYPDADRITYLRQPVLSAGVPNADFSFAEVADFRTMSTSFDEIVEFGDWTFNVIGRGEPHLATGGLVTSNYFNVLGIQASLGRTLYSDDDGHDAEPVMVLTYEYWQRVFGSDSSAVGQVVQLQPKSVRIVGVLEPGSHYASQRRQDFYVNYTTNDHYMGASMQDERSHRMTTVLARVALGVAVETARAELKQIHAQFKDSYPEHYSAELGYDLTVTPWQEVLTENARPTLLILLGTVALVLIMACANVGNLALTRLIRKERELAIRSALGATQGRIRGQLLGESLVLSLLGGALGVVVAVATLESLVTYTARFTLRTGEIGVDGWVLAFTMIVATLAATAFAWFPKLSVSDELASSLTSAASSRSTGSITRRRAQRALVVSQLAVSFVLLIGAGLLVRSLVNLYRVEPGFDLENVLTMSSMGSGVENINLVAEGVLQSARRFPGVSSIATASFVPFRISVPRNLDVRVESEATPIGVRVPTSINRVSPEYFATIGTPVVRGRGFTMMDRENTEHVAVINESLADALFANESPLGQRIAYAFQPNQWAEWLTVVGVVADTKAYGLTETGVHTIYVPPAQQRVHGTSFLVRTNGDPMALAEFMVDAIHEVDPNRPVEDIFTLGQLRSENVAPFRLNATLFGTFALLALVIATVGVGGVLAFSVSQRTNEFGIRMTLGADQHRVLKMVLKEGAVLAGIGVAVGGAGALIFSRFMSQLLYEVEAVDPLTFGAVGAGLFGIAILASLLPAHRATTVDPITAVRTE